MMAAKTRVMLLDGLIAAVCVMWLLNGARMWPLTMLIIVFHRHLIN